MPENTEKVIQEYNADQIQVLEGLEAVRMRPGMYIGSTSASGLHHLVYEIVDNAIDEALAGYCTHIEVTIEPGNIIRVSDNGRGIPVDTQEQTGKSALEVVYTVLHAGGKFGGGGYKVSGGLHGVGASVVNALSEWLEVQVSRDGKVYQMRFSRGLQSFRRSARRRRIGCQCAVRVAGGTGKPGRQSLSDALLPRRYHPADHGCRQGGNHRHGCTLQAGQHDVRRAYLQL